MKRKAPGILPGPHWLKLHGHHALVTMMQRHPGAFAHIDQDYRGGHTAEEWLAEAKRLVKQFGILPNQGWLQTNGLASLARMIVKYPRLFSQVKQESKRGHTANEWVEIAALLAKTNNGILPCQAILKRTGKHGLVNFIRQQPNLFDHLKQESRRGRSVSEWVSIAKSLVEKNGGVLPSYSQLRHNGYQSLDYMMRKYPSQFQHLRQQKLRGKKPTEWVPFAERLAKRHKGVLPARKTLIECYGYGLVLAMQRHPRLFAHIKQKRLRK